MIGKIRNYKSVVWDYNLKQDDFEKILKGKKVMGKFDQLWAIKRVLENLNFYEAMAIIPKSLFISNWNKIRSKVFNRSIIKGYDFLLHRYTLSTTRQSTKNLE
ncbi:hypothetical protein AUK05_00390 [Candidatus Shapirobacteria bacterium CG2_30_35_20]|uniref:Uncharacterized protein n=1 Tax=Candidatus Shapirobacteria bacterium CG2_30_35_20 TaxID=1805376 RepID=A0A1J5HSK0_9BACT|nr:MAG: hypothetical protein AUK05_00390 [Candidatus Shapirobacteria bacterium CG2_30_35_20]